MFKKTILALLHFIWTLVFLFVYIIWICTKCVASVCYKVLIHLGVFFVTVTTFLAIYGAYRIYTEYQEFSQAETDQQKIEWLLKKPILCMQRFYVSFF